MLSNSRLLIASGVIAIFAALTKSQGFSVNEFRLPFGFLILSIICGVFFFLSMSDAIYKTQESETPLNRLHIRISGIIQSISFLVGMIILVWMI